MRPFTICFTGMSGSGKTTLSLALEKKLREKNFPLQLIDGDVLREQLGHLFGYTREERMKNSRVTRVLCKYLNDNGISVIVAIVAPYEEMRMELRDYLGESYIQVFANSSLETCEKRDVKGYYQSQRQGLLQHLNGVDDVFEIPIHCEISIDTEGESVGDGVYKIISYLRERGYDV